MGGDRGRARTRRSEGPARPRRQLTAAPRLFALAAALACTPPAAAQTVAPVPAALRADYGIARGFYAKYVDAGGIPVLGSPRVSDAALMKARANILTLIPDRPAGVVAALRAQRVRVVILARGESVRAIPEYAAAFPDRTRDAAYWAGFGATPALPIVAGTEDNLLGNRNAENVFVHEFAHTVAEMALAADAGFANAWAAAWNHARGAGLWAKTYAGSHKHEYWAEGVQSYFDVNREGPPGGDGVHNHANTRDGLRTHDPKLFALIDAVYGGRMLRND